MRITLIAAALGLLAACGASEETDVDTEVTEAATAETVFELDVRGDDALTEELSTHVREVLSETGVPALGVAIVTAEGGVIATVVGGERVAGEGDPVRVDDLWHIGSDTKAVTAAMFAREVERGNLSWGVGLGELAPELADGMDPAWQSVVIEDFFAHTSGLEGLPRSFFRTARRSRLPLEEQRRELIEERFSDPPEDSRAYAYSNFNYVVAGAVLEANASGSWEDLTREFFFDLGVAEDSFGFGPPLGDQPEGHERYPPRAIGKGPGADNPLALGPAGTMHVSLETWGTFVQLFLTGGGELLSPESIEKLLAPWPNDDADYGMGWGMADAPTGKMYFHAGSNTLWLAQVVMVPEDGFAVLIVTNHGGDAGETAVVSLTQLALGAMRSRVDEAD